ncbi:MAG: lysophospholipid acyltransferase family protein [Nitrospira sp.]|nr:lysophospholipid acyltransferase family protein [Nitrospira sp.]
MEGEAVNDSVTHRPPAGPQQKQALTKRLTNALKVAVVPPVGYAVIRLLQRTMSWRTEGGEHVSRIFAQGQRTILAFWHAQQLMMPLAIPGLKAHILISQHRDGELICRIVARFGLDAVRGSSTRGGAEAFRRLVRLGRSGGNLVLTPDGPKGPRQVAKVGVVQLARATGLPIIPMAFGCSKKNSSRAGTDSSCPIRSRRGSFSSERRFQSRLTHPLRTWNACAASWKRP